MAHDYTAPRRTNDSPIARARLARGWTQQRLADALGVKQAQVANWETGFRRPKLDALRRIADALGTDLAALISSGTQND